MEKHEEHNNHIKHPFMEHKKHSEHEGMIEDFKKRFYISIILTIPIVVLTPMIQYWLGLENRLSFCCDIYVLFILSSIVFFYGGYPFLKGLFDELKNLRPGMMTLIGLAITVAYVYSSIVVFGLKGEIFFWELATLIDIMLLGHWIEMKSIMGASKALEELARLMPGQAHKLSAEGNIVDVKIEELHVKDIVLVKPGEKFPADGIIKKGETSVNESMLTGESKPVYKNENSKVIGGSINGESSVEVLINKTGKDSFLSQIIELVREAQESKSKTQDLANRAALWLTIIAISSGFLTIIFWLLIFNADFAFSLERTVTVMVITCPHALGLAIPLVVSVSTSLGARNGLLIKNRTAFENARNVTAILFDKTGTLTQGKFGISDITLLKDNLNEDEIIKLAASIERNSEHPIGKAIANSSKSYYVVTGFKAIPGKGAEGKINNETIKVVSPGYLKDKKIDIEESKTAHILEQGNTVVFLLRNDEAIASISLVDIIRPESKEAIKELKEMGIKSIMITGDNKQVAASVSKVLCLDEYFAEVLPDKKVDKVKELKQRGFITAMTGDGVNDAPALAEADIGIAVGAGTDVAIETADVILIKSNPLDVVSVIKLSEATYNKMVQNLLWATGYNLFAIPLAAGVLYSVDILLSPALGAVLMSLSTVIVAINARFLKL